MTDLLDPMPTQTISPSSRLVRDGKLLSWLARACLIVMVVIAVLEIGALALRSEAAGLVHGGFAFSIDMRWLDPTDRADPRFVSIDRFTVWQSSLAAALLALRLAPGIVILLSLVRLFGYYGRGQVFTAQNEYEVRLIARALIAYAIVPLITHATLFAAGMSDIAIKLEIRQLDALVAGAIVLAVARVVSFGCAIDEDRNGFV